MRPEDGANQRFLALLQSGLEQASITGPTRLLVALSGGADSLALLLGLHQICSDPGPGIQVEAAHFNHQIREDVSGSDEEFCVGICGKLGVKLHVGSADVPAFAAANRLSIETAARDLRYRFLAETVDANTLDAVVTGHTMDDQAETVLLALTRGAGLRGLSGMPFASDRHDLAINNKPLSVVRPILTLRRSDTEAFCEFSGLTPRQDESNTDLAYARNRVRHNVIPELQQINSGVVEAISRLARITSQDVTMIDQVAAKELDEASVDTTGTISKAALRKMPPALRTHVLAAAYLRSVGSVRDLDTISLLSATKAVNELDSGSIDLPNNTKLLIEHDAVRFLVGDADPGCPYPETVGEHSLNLGATVEFPGGETLSARVVSPVPDPTSLNRWQAIVNFEVMRDQPLQVRSRRDGDRFHSLGMEGEMKLQDFFVNRHIPARWRDRVPLVLADADICWIAGERVAEWAKVSDVADKAVLLEYVNPE